jgi:hypothetical protein
MFAVTRTDAGAICDSFRGLSRENAMERCGEALGLTACLPLAVVLDTVTLPCTGSVTLLNQIDRWQHPSP